MVRRAGSCRTWREKSTGGMCERRVKKGKETRCTHAHVGPLAERRLKFRGEGFSLI